MSIVFPKNKEKRPRSSSSEANNSFVKNVTSRVSGLLPATITKWFSSPSSSTANGSAQTDNTDSSTDDEAPESPITMQPPAKRMRYSPPGNYNHYSVADINNVPPNMETIDSCTPYTTQRPTRSNLRRDVVSTPRQSPLEESERTEKESPTFKTQHSVSSAGPSVATKRKSLFDFPTNSEVSMRACAKTANNTMRDPSQPCFKPSLLGSPFYPGRTMYGGASASYINQPNIIQRKNTQVNETNNVDNTISHSARRIMDLLEHYSSPLSEAKRLPPYVRNTKNTSPNTSLDSSHNTSKNTSYKLQELHVPSIASILRLKKRSRLMDSTKAARQIIASHSSTSDYLPNSTRESDTDCSYSNTNQLTTKVKSKVVKSARGETSNVEHEMPAPLNLPPAVLEIGPDNLPKFTLGNLETSNSFTSSTPRLQPSKTKGTTEGIPQYKPLETYFSKTKNTGISPFKPPESSLMPPSETKRSEPVKPPGISLSNPVIVADGKPYTFSNPVQISSATNPTAFVFSSPERSIDKLRVNNRDDDVPCVIGATKDKETSNWTCPDCWVSNKPDVDQCVCCTAKRPTQVKDKSKSSSKPFAEINTVKVNNISQPLEVKSTESSKWKCKDCWVENDKNAESCVCCGYKPGKQEEEWKCDDCWIKNKASVEQCAACGKAKPGTKPSAAPTPTATSGFFAPATSKPDLFKTMVNSQNDKWECPNCLVRNESNKTKCACCETEKPGSTIESEKKTFNFGNSTFKFGIDPNLNKPDKETEAAKVEPKTIVSDPKPKPSETNNNVLNETPTFTFALPAKKTGDQTDSARPASEAKEPPKMNFSFGIPKSDSTPSATTTTTVASPTSAAAAAPALVFGIPSKPADTPAKPEDKERPQEVPKIDLTTPKTSKPVPDMFKFTSPSKSKSFANPLVNTTTSENKVAPSATLSLAASTSAEDKSKPTATFSFSGVKLASNLFAVPAPGTSGGISFPSAVSTTAATTAAPTSIFTLPATTTSTPSLFPTTEAPKNTMALFQKNDPSATTTATSTLGSTSLFSFGTSNTQASLNPSSVTQADKPKFNFTFGSDSTKTFGSDTPKAFGAEPEKPKPFGIDATKSFGGDANKSFTSETKTDNQWSFKNSFGGSNTLLGSGNGLANNTLGGNGLPSGGNGLPAGNTGISTGGNGLTTGGVSLTTGGMTGTANALATGNSVPNSGFLSNNMLGGNGLSNPLGNSTDLTSNSLTSGNALNNNATPASGGVFGLGAPKEHIWSTNNTTSNPFVPNTTANSLQKPAAFTFGSATSFNSSQPVQFGAGGGGTNVFGSGQAGQTGLFSSTAASPPAPVFGSPQPPAGLFGTPALGFGTPKPNFEAPSLGTTPAPAFNFGSSQQSPGIFGFGQQQQQQAQQPQQPQQPGVYNFGSAPAPGSQVQFNMGSVPNKAVRPFRKAVRRTRPR